MREAGGEVSKGGRPRLPDAIRQAVAEDIARTLGTLDGSTRKIAARCGVSMTTVRRIMTEVGVTSGEARAITKSAAQTTRANNEMRRAQLSEAALNEARLSLEDIRKPIDPSMPNVFHPPKDRYYLALVVGILTDKHRMLGAMDSDTREASAVDAFLDHITGDEPKR